ncbi:hypothetical protein L484_000413 [Morus notabilis]|uniref:Uncharacterized protein n=1 Tax=Morus notabilis TaxID=981085 RepID=W9T1Z2_9ROSA|nr:hypothetical protein L484_000413 [Morus notabilis]
MSQISCVPRVKTCLLFLFTLQIILGAFLRRGGKVVIMRLFKVNGQPIFIRGGNWILSDGLLRLSKKRYSTDIKFHADMNLNMLRCWAGGLAERPEFYYYCDLHGLLALAASMRGIPEPIFRGAFLNGLREDVRAEVKLLRPINLQEVMDLAQQIEERNEAVDRPFLTTKPLSFVSFGPEFQSTLGPLGVDLPHRGPDRG